MSAEPFTAYAFAVELRLPGRDEPLCQAAFCECEGLELRRQILTWREGGDAERARLLAGQESVGHVTLRRGMTATFDLWDWWERVRREPGLRATCDLVVLSPGLAAERVRFRLHGCLPAKLTAPDLNAAANEVAIESLEIACEGVEILRPGQKPYAPRRAPIVKAELRELDDAFEREINPHRWVTAQVNPLQLRTALRHEPTPSARLDVQLAFDVRALDPADRDAAADVRRLTERVAYFATPRPTRAGASALPAVRLAWGTFRFDGRVESFEESIDVFSADGRPLRASLALSLARPQIEALAPREP